MTHRRPSCRQNRPHCSPTVAVAIIGAAVLGRWAMAAVLNGLLRSVVQRASARTGPDQDTTSVCPTMSPPALRCRCTHATHYIQEEIVCQISRPDRHRREPRRRPSHGRMLPGRDARDCDAAWIHADGSWIAGEEDLCCWRSRSALMVALLALPQSSRRTSQAAHDAVYRVFRHPA